MFDAALVANFVASAMMNGVCCVHTMQEDERRMQEQSETLKSAIRSEWERQRQFDREHHKRIRNEAAMEAASKVAEERRRSLMAAKLRAAQSLSSKDQDRKDNSTILSKHTMPELDESEEKTQYTSLQEYSRSAFLIQDAPRIRRDSELSSLIDLDSDEESIDTSLFK